MLRFGVPPGPTARAPIGRAIWRAASSARRSRKLWSSSRVERMVDRCSSVADSRASLCNRSGERMQARGWWLMDVPPSSCDVDRSAMGTDEESMAHLTWGAPYPETWLIERSSWVRGRLMGGVAACLELERGVLDVEMAGQAALQLVEQGGQVSVLEAGVVHHDVRGQHRQACSDLAGVQVVHRLNPGDLEQMLANLAQLQPSGGGLQQNVDALAQDLQGARNDQRPDQQRSQRVGT